MNPHTSFVFILILFFSSLSTNAQDNDPQLLTLDYTILDSLVEVQYKKGRFGDAIPYLQAARQKAKLDYGMQDSIFAEYTFNLGFFYTRTGQYSKALTLYIQAKDIREKVLGVEHPSFASSLNNLAVLQKKMGNIDKALPLYIQSIDIRKKTLGPAHPSLANPINNLAFLYQSQGNYDLAEPLFLEAQKIVQKEHGLEHPLFINSLIYLANFHQDLGNLDRALPLFIQTKNTTEKVYGLQHPKHANSLNYLALLYTKMNEDLLALPLYIQAKDIREKTLGKEHADYATSLNNLAALYQKMNRSDDAFPLFIEAKNIREKTLGKTHPEYTNSLNNLANLHQKIGHYEKALALYTQAVDIRSATLGTTHPLFANALLQLTDVYDKLGQKEQAWEHLLLVIKALTNQDLSRPITAEWSNKLIDLNYASNLHLENLIRSLALAHSFLKNAPSSNSKQEQQVILSDLALQLLTQLERNTSSDKDKLRILSISNYWLQKSLESLQPKEHSSKAFSLADHNKSVLLSYATKSDASYRLGELPDSLVWKDKKMQKTQSLLKAKLLEKRSPQQKEQLTIQLNSINQEIDKFATSIQENYPKYYALKYQQEDASVASIQEQLDDQTALIEYVITDSLVHIFYVDKTTINWVQQAIPNKELKSNIQALHHVLSDYRLLSKKQGKSYQKYTDLAFWFYKNLMAPVLDAPAHKKNPSKNLVLITDGELGHLPFEAFLVEQAPQALTAYNQLHYLVNDFNISYNYSATLWKSTILESKENSSQNNGQILAMAGNYSPSLDSAYNNRLSTERALRKTLIPLPAAKKEVETLEQSFEGFFAYDQLANESTIKKIAPQYAIIHLAMHGILNSKMPVLSSLAFTEDGNPLENNFWQAHEISKMQLNADLVVLSACETGYGKFEQGNGIASLARAFMYAGASSLIVSLWQVNDYATSEIMKILYHNLAAGMPKDEALRQAKLHYMKIANDLAAHPAFWSAFIQIGNTSSIKLTQKNPTKLGIWAGLGLLLLLVLGLGYRKITAKANQKL